MHVRIIWKRSGYERSHDHFKPAGRVCLLWVSSFEKYMTVFLWILVYWCYGFWHRLPEEIIILVIFDKSVFYFFWRNLDSRRGRVAPHVLPTISVRHGTLVQKKIEKREADFKGEVSIHCFCSKLIKNDHVYGYVLKNWHNFTGMNGGCSKATTMATATRT